jgi:hypothetical protein
MLIPTTPFSSSMASCSTISGTSTFHHAPAPPPLQCASTSSLFSSPLPDDFATADWKSLLLTTVIRGGELFARQQSERLDINRVRMRLEGLQAYGTLCALLANGCLRLYSSVSDTSRGSTETVDNDSPNKAQSSKNIRKHLALDGFFLCVVLSVLSGSYTTVVFTLLPLYSKMALGRGYDAQFLQFWASTAGIRETGFTAFLLSLVSFEVAFVLSLYLRLRGRRKRMLVLIATIICAVSFWEWTRVMQLASIYLFTLRAETEY